MFNAIGIDLGTAYSRVAVFRQGKVEIIPNDHGNRKTPSVIAFNDDGILIGDSAKNQATRNPINTVFDGRLLVGHKYNDSIIQASMKYWPFKLIDEDQKLKVQVEYQGEVKSFTPEIVLSMILIKMKKIAEDYLKSKISGVVLTIPSYYNYYQRYIIKYAAALAEINLLDTINSSIAAAIYYGLENKILVERNILVCDLGSATLSISVVKLDEGFFEVKATAGKMMICL